MSLLIEPELHLERISSFDPNQSPLLAVHGLNQNPDSLKKLLNDLSHLGFCTYLLHLPGHQKKELRSHLTANDFYSAYQKAYLYLKEAHTLPIVGLGYSLGGLIMYSQREKCPLGRMILMAPALEIKPYTHIIKAFIPWLSHIRSYPLEKKIYEPIYRYHQTGVPSPIYKSFFSIYGDWQKIKRKQAQQRNGSKERVLVFSQPGDEIVSHQGLKSWFIQQGRGQFVEIKGKDAQLKSFRHLFVDDTTLGTESYRFLLASIEDFLKKN